MYNPKLPGLTSILCLVTFLISSRQFSCHQHFQHLVTGSVFSSRTFGKKEQLTPALAGCGLQLFSVSCFIASSSHCSYPFLFSFGVLHNTDQFCCCCCCLILNYVFYITGESGQALSSSSLQIAELGLFVCLLNPLKEYSIFIHIFLCMCLFRSMLLSSFTSGKLGKRNCRVCICPLI